MEIKTYRDIPKFPQIHYMVDVGWADLEHHLDRYNREYRLQLDPDFQRGHVWSEAQQTAYIEFMLKGGESGKNIFLNHPGWMGSFKGEFVLVDGLQRITAARRFINDEIPAYGRTASQLGRIPSLDYGFKFHIAKLQTRAEVLKWYLDFNAGGTPHSKEEIDRVRALLTAEPKVEG